MNKRYYTPLVVFFDQILGFGGMTAITPDTFKIGWRNDRYNTKDMKNREKWPNDRYNTTRSKNCPVL